MKYLSNFEAFKLNKNQMNAIAGGKATKIFCRVTLADGEEIYLCDVAKDLTIDEANASVQKAYGAIGEANCYEATYVESRA